MRVQQRIAGALARAVAKARSAFTRGPLAKAERALDGRKEFKKREQRPPAAWVRAWRAWQRGRAGYYATEFMRGDRCGPARRRVARQQHVAGGV